MIRNSMAVAFVVYVVLAGVTIKECLFLMPLRGWIWEQYGQRLLIFSGLLLFNTFACAYGALRKLALKDTGDKLAHLEKQLRGRETISEELSGRIAEKL